MLTHCAGDGDKKPDRREEHGISRNTIAQGMPDCFGEPVVDLLVCFFPLHARLRVSLITRRSLRPLLQGEKFGQSSGVWRREKEKVCQVRNSSLPATNAKRLREERTRRSNPALNPM
ncbi:hypothetical protein [Bradyrhizobium sp.]|uniref:hypothetical protein n=1 Tax=Bradyrhizobium sp. TaxID=376 RepID=UPI002D35FCD2|nr:hypothetical protein [Bradyrhizobium sp.]HZR75720.1 hypothetical protein [Bradyrhizobium sp.]